MVGSITHCSRPQPTPLGAYGAKQDEIARTLAAMEKIEPFEMTDGERAAIEADRQARKEWEKAQFDEHADRLRRIWE